MGKAAAMARTLEQRYLDALQRLRMRVDGLEEMVRWKDELASRLWRAQAVMRVTGSGGPIEELEKEVQRFTLVATAMNEKPWTKP